MVHYRERLTKEGNRAADMNRVKNGKLNLQYTEWDKRWSDYKVKVSNKSMRV